MTQNQTNEAEYYIPIIQKYSEILDPNAPDAQIFNAKEIIKTMHQLGEKSQPTSSNNQSFQNIAANTLILLISLFTPRDETTQYSEFAELSDTERQTVKNTLAATLPGIN